MTIKGKKFKIVFRRGRPLTKVVLIGMIALCTVALVALRINTNKEEARLKTAKSEAVTQEQAKKDQTDKINRLGSEESVKEIAAEHGMYPEGTIIVETE